MTHHAQINDWLWDKFKIVNASLVQYQINDRTSFQRFLRLERSSQIPDSKTLWAFRERIKKAEVSSDLFAEAKRRIGAKGCIAR